MLYVRSTHSRFVLVLIVVVLMLVVLMVTVSCTKESTTRTLGEPTVIRDFVDTQTEPIQPTIAGLAVASVSQVVVSSATIRGSEDPAAMATRLGREAWDFLEAFTMGHSPRESGTEDERIAAEFLFQRLSELDYDVHIQSFSYETPDSTFPVFDVDSVDAPFIAAIPMTLSGMGRVTTTLFDAGDLVTGEPVSGEVEGKIALVERGTITFQEKVAKVTDAGAAAIVVYNNKAGLFQGRLMEQADIPAVSVSQAHGDAIKRLLLGGEVTGTVNVTVEERNSRNVIAEKPGTYPGSGVVVLGAHFDTVAATQGANDNGSGVATLLTIARQIVDREFPFTLRFIMFGSEELGLFGSRHYVDGLTDRQVQDIVAMLNFDVLGSGRTVEIIGTPDLVNLGVGYGQQYGLNVRKGTPLDGAGSDHQPFAEVGVSVAFLLADDLSRINAPGDDLAFVDSELIGVTVVLGLAILDELAEP